MKCVVWRGTWMVVGWRNKRLARYAQCVCFLFSLPSVAYPFRTAGEALKKPVRARRRYLSHAMAHQLSRCIDSRRALRICHHLESDPDLGPPRWCAVNHHGSSMHTRAMIHCQVQPIQQRFSNRSAIQENLPVLIHTPRSAISRQHTRPSLLSSVLSQCEFKKGLTGFQAGDWNSR
ncbi:hypothetical protein EV673_1300 [Limnobacter thiooxidans]|nr:hypothetical protein EV673_1300 [Limnobacter thiooxidans]